MAFCTHCGSEGTGRFCGVCGAMNNAHAGGVVVPPASSPVAPKFRPILASFQATLNWLLCLPISLLFVWSLNADIMGQYWVAAPVGLIMFSPTYFLLKHVLISNGLSRQPPFWLALTFALIGIWAFLPTLVILALCASATWGAWPNDGIPRYLMLLLVPFLMMSMLWDKFREKDPQKVAA